MGYDELLRQAQEHPNTPIQVSLADLLECNKQMFEMMRIEMMSSYRALHREKIVSREQTAELLKVDLSTLHRWNKRGILKATRIGGKVYYYSDDVQKMIDNKNR